MDINCADTPLLEPDKKIWLECSKGFAKRNLVIGIIVTSIILLIILGIMYFNGFSGSIYGFIPMAFVGIIGSLAIGIILYSYSVSETTALQQWEKAKRDISRRTGNLEMFDNFDELEADAKNNLRKEWVKQGLEIQEDQREKEALLAQQRMSRNNFNRRYSNHGNFGNGITLNF